MSLEAPLSPAILDRAVEGDEAAFAHLVGLYHADLMRVAYVTCGDADLAADAVQSAWTIAWRKLGTVRDRSSVKGWLVAVAANEARQLARRQHRRTVVELKVGSVGVPGSGDAWWDASARDPGVGIERVDLVNALGHLKPEDRMLLALRYVAGLDSFEIAARTGRSPSGTRARLARLLGRMREELGHG